MPQNDTGNFVGGFGEMFFKTLQSERERQDKLNQQQQEFSQKSREMNLINAFRNAQLKQDQSQFQTKTEQDQLQFGLGMDFKNKSLLEDARQFDTGLEFKQQEADRDFQIDKSQIGLGYSNLAQRKKEFEFSKMKADGDRSEVDQRDVEKLFGDASALLDENKSGVGSDKYSKWKSDASGVTTQLLEKLKIPINGEVVNTLRGVLDDNDDSETKRSLLNEAINEYYKMGKITDEQKRALQLWKELGTR